MHKKVLQLRSSVGFFGAENVIMEVAKAIVDSPYEPIIGVLENSHNPHTELAAVARKNGVTSKIFPCDGRFSRQTAAAVRQYMVENEIAIVHAHGYKADFYALFATLNTGYKRVATIHPWLIESNRASSAKFYMAFDKALLRSFHSIVAISDEMRAQVVRDGMKPARVVTIENGIDLQRFAAAQNVAPARQDFGIPAGARVIGAVGRLSEEKGHTVLLAAAKSLVAEFPDLCFMLVGDGPEREKLMQEVAALGLQKHVIFAGVCSDIPKALAVMDIFVLPSLTEGLPMALLEAMAAKKPIIATAVGSIPRVIRNQENGVIVPPRDAPALSQALKILLNHRSNALRFADGAFKDVLSFSAATMGKKYVKLYDQLVEHQSTGVIH